MTINEQFNMLDWTNVEQVRQWVSDCVAAGEWGYEYAEMTAMSLDAVGTDREIIMGVLDAATR